MPDFGDVDPDTGRTSERTQWEGTQDPNAQRLSPAEWAEYQAKRKRDAILGTLGIIGGTSAASGLASMIGGGAATLPAAATEGMLPMSVAGGAGAAVPAVAAATLPAAATEGMLPASVAAPAAGEGARRFLGLTPQDWARIAVTVPSTVAAVKNNNNDTTPTSATQDPQMKELLEFMMQRLRKSEPNFDSAQAMAQGLLPTQYQRGGGGMG